MKGKAENPFERFDLDPRQGPRGITEKLRELAEDAKTDDERAAIRAAWEELTLHPMRRLRAALSAAPETRAPRAPCPPLSEGDEPAKDAPLGLRDLAVLPSVARALGPEPTLPAALAPITDDPLLQAK